MMRNIGLGEVTGSPAKQATDEDEPSGDGTDEDDASGDAEPGDEEGSE